jgi:hypothetical protein
MPRGLTGVLWVALGVLIGAGVTATLKAAGTFEGPRQLGVISTYVAWRLDTRTGHLEQCYGWGGGTPVKCYVMQEPRASD